VSRGRPMPDESPGPEAANCIVLFEEDRESAVRKRLEALGADMHRVFLGDRNGGDWGELVCFPDDTKALAEHVAAVRPRLVVIDPIISFLGPGVNVNNDQSVRRALRPLRDLARAYDFVPLLVRNLNKAGSQQALYRGTGAMALIAACRTGYLFDRDP